MYQVTLYHISKSEVVEKFKAIFQQRMLNFSHLSGDQYGTCGEIKIIDQEDRIVVQFNTVGLTRIKVKVTVTTIREMLSNFGQYTFDNAITLGDIANRLYVNASTAYTVLNEAHHPVVHIVVGEGILLYQALRRKVSHASNCCPDGISITVTGSDSEVSHEHLTVGSYYVEHGGEENAHTLCTLAIGEMVAKVPTVIAYLVERQKTIRLMPVL